MNTYFNEITSKPVNTNDSGILYKIPAGAFSGDGFEIWVDVETGVNYLWRATGYAGGLTVLLDRDGKPVITPILNK